MTEEAEDRRGKVFLDCVCGNEHEVEPGTFVALYCNCGRTWSGFIPATELEDTKGQTG